MQRLVCGDIQALISPLGAELRAWSFGSQELLWTSDTAVWDAVAPILFPIVGWARDGVIRVDGRPYAIGVHGFAARRRFVVADASPTQATFVDRADAQTLQQYPFAYRLAVTFALEAQRLRCMVEIANEGPVPMPYAVGFHPGFRWPADKPAQLTFATREEPSVPAITDKGLFSSERRPLAFDGRALPLTRELLSREALCFLHMRSHDVTYEAEGFGRLKIAGEDMPHLALWSRPPAPFLCLESWTGHGDPDDFAGELRDKPSMRMLAPGACARHAVHYAFTPLHSGAGV